MKQRSSMDVQYSFFSKCNNTRKCKYEPPQQTQHNKNNMPVIDESRFKKSQ